MLMVLVYKFLSVLPIPGVNADALQNMIESQK
jgi:preprotein translocase subunit SecY